MSCRKIGKFVWEVWIMTSDMHCCAAAMAADFLGFGSSTAAADESFLPESPPAEPSGFNMDSQPAAHPAPPPAATSSKPAAPRPAAPSSMIDFGDEAAMLAQNSELYQGLEAVEGMTVCSLKPDIAYAVHRFAFQSRNCCSVHKVVGGLQLPMLVCIMLVCNLWLQKSA